MSEPFGYLPEHSESTLQYLGMFKRIGEAVVSGINVIGNVLAQVCSAIQDALISVKRFLDEMYPTLRDIAKYQRRHAKAVMRSRRNNDAKQRKHGRRKRIRCHEAVVGDE